MTQFSNLTIAEVHKGLVEKKFSAQEITQQYLAVIKEKDKEIGAYLQVNEDLALEQAREVDDLITREEKLPLLAGVPAAVKDVILVKGFRSTAASKILENYQAPYDATCIKNLREQKVVFLGKTNLDEFAMGSSTEHSAFKKTKNPHDLERVPGGTSGGSAAAVASQECVFALGSDTGGSIRQPASFCGVVGFKPTYGAVSRYGLIAHASSLDQIGPLTKNAEDCEAVFKVISGKDSLDSTSVDYKFSIFNFQFSNLKIGIPKEYFGEGIEKGVREVIEGMIKKIEKEGAKVEEISLPHSKYALACYYIISTSEASANLERYDGIKYGLSKDTSDLLDVYLKTRSEGFGDEVKRRIMLGTFALSSGYYDAYYLRAQKVRTLVKQDFDAAFTRVDFILAPVSPFPAFKLGEKVDDPLKMYLSDIYTVPVNLAGLPALSLPCPVRNCESKISNGACGKTRKLPVGLQIIGRPFSEPEIFQFAKLVEKL